MEIEKWILSHIFENTRGALKYLQGTFEILEGQIKNKFLGTRLSGNLRSR